MRCRAHARTSTLDFGSGNTSQLFFAGVGAHTPGTGVLMITHWNGIPFAQGNASTDRLIFAGATTAFTNLYAQADVSFNGVGGYQAIQFDTNHFEIVAIPEPSSTALLFGAGLLGLVGFRERSRVFGKKRQS